MNNNIYEVDFTRSLPPSLRHDPKVMALASIIAGNLKEVSSIIDKTIIYGNIDALPEEVLDILAYDFHVDWYEYDYPLEAKRNIIKDCVKVHKRLGTKYSVETALGNLHPNSEIEEWQDYKGEPFSFRIVLDTTKSRLQINIEQIKKTIESYKRLSSHLDEIIFQCNIKGEIICSTDFYRYKNYSSGRIKSGEKPCRNFIGKQIDRDIKINIEESRFPYIVDVAGTNPERNIKSGLSSNEVTARVEKDVFRHRSLESGSNKAGEKPYINFVGKEVSSRTNAEAEKEFFKCDFIPSGSVNAGEFPYDNIRGANHEKSVLTQNNTADIFGYNTKRCGTKRCGK